MATIRVKVLPPVFDTVIASEQNVIACAKSSCARKIACKNRAAALYRSITTNNNDG